MSARGKRKAAPKAKTEQRSGKRSLDTLIAALREADAQFSKALDNRNNFDGRGSSSPESSARKAEDKAIARAESRAAVAADKAMLALCKYRPKTGDELSRFVRTVFQHERVRYGLLNEVQDSPQDRHCAAALLASVNASVVSLLIQGVR